MTKHLLIALCFTTTFACPNAHTAGRQHFSGGFYPGRFTTLQQVVDHYSEHVAASSTLSPFLQNNSNTPHGIQLELATPEKQDLLAFLHMLTDPSFITDTRFSDPFINQ